MLEPLNWEKDRARAQAVAAHYGFAFYIFWGIRCEYRGWKSEERPATEEEEEMWRLLDSMLAEKEKTP